MIETIKERTLISLESHGLTIQGTYHPSCDQNCGSIDEQNRIGILFLNSLSLARSGIGDSAVYWADSFAANGYPSVRIDLSGLGDSDGDIPEDLLEFINSGGYAEIVSSIVKWLVGSLNISGVVIVGHCAGSVSALYAAAANNDCKGLVLMDQYFYLPPRVKQYKAFKRLSGVASQSGLDGSLTRFYDMVKDLWMSLRENAPPRNANFALLQRWKDVATKGLPILLLKSPGQMTFRLKPGMREFDYIKYVLKLAGRLSKVSVQVVEGADHSFANRLGRDAVRQYAERWLSLHFPLVEAGDSAECRMLSAVSESGADHENQMSCL